MVQCRRSKIGRKGRSVVVVEYSLKDQDVGRGVKGNGVLASLVCLWHVVVSAKTLSATILGSC